MKLTEILSEIINDLSAAAQIRVMRYNSEAYPYPLNGPAIAVGIKSVKAKLSSLGGDEKLFDAVFILDIYAPSAEQCYDTADKVFSQLTARFIQITVGAVAPDNNDGYFCLPILCTSRWIERSENIGS
jgi:hypothetical protein